MAEDYTSRFSGPEIDARLAKIPTLESEVSGKQDALQSGKNIKTINGQSIVGAGNIDTGGQVTVDSELSETSTNPVQNKVIKSALNGKQETIPDLDTIRTGANKGSSAYQKPANGIPASDLESGVVPDVSGFVTKSVNDLLNYYLKSETYTKAEVQSLIGSIQQFHYEIAESTSSVSSPSSNVLYLIGPSGSGSDVYEQYVYDSTKTDPWIKIGDTSIDLSGYVTITALNSALASYVTSSALESALANCATKSEVSQLQQKVTDIEGGSEIQDIEWVDGMVYNGVAVSSNASYKRSGPIRVYAGDTVSFTGGAPTTAITVQAIAKYDNGAYSSIVDYTTQQQENISWTAQEECDIIISSDKALFSGDVVIVKRGDIPRIEGEITRIDGVNQGQAEDIEELQLELIGAFANPSPEGYFISTAGNYAATPASSIVGEYMAVAEGEVVVYSGGFANAPSTDGLYMVWGYSDTNGSNPTPLLINGTYENTEVQIPSGVNYVRAWSLIAKNPILLKKGSVGTAPKDVKKLQENSFEKVNVSTNLFNKATVVHGYYVAYYDGDLRALSHFWTSDYIEIEPDASYIMSRQQQLAFYNANKQYISGIASPSGSFQSPATAKYIRICGDETLLDVWALYKGTAVSPYTPYAEGYKDFYINESNVIKGAETIIIATRNSANFNSIREIINSITDASETKRYVIFVPAGRWFECDLQGKPFVSILGEDRDKTVIYCDGTSDNITPDDYFFAVYRGVALNTIPQSNKHVFFATNNLDVHNVTIEGNDIKYCVHLDKDGWSSASFDNCHFIAKENVNTPVGIGIHGGQKISVTNSIVERTITGSHGFICHNWNNQSEPTELTFENCYFKRCGFGLIDELGSEQDDDWKILNCYSDVGGEIRWMVDYDSDGKTYWINPATGQKETDPTAVPYCIHLNCLGSNVERVFKQKFSSTNIVSRPDCAKYTITDYFKAMQAEGREVGKVIRGYATGHTYVEGDGYPVIGVVDSIVDGIAYIAHKNVIVESSNLYGEIRANGTPVYVRSDGYLTTVVTGDQVGVISEDYFGLGKVIHLF